MSTQTVILDQQALRVALAKRGWSTTRLAGEVGLSPGYVRQLSRGLVPSERHRKAIAAALGVETSILWPAAPSAERSAA